MSRFWPGGRPIAVEADELGTPVALVWGGRRHAVASVLERWRVDEGWWRRRAWREYVTLLTASGLLLTAYRELPGGAWRIQRLYD